MYFAIVSMRLLCWCGCTDCFRSESLNFQDFAACEELRLGKLEKRQENHSVGPPNFRPSQMGEGERPVRLRGGSYIGCIWEYERLMPFRRHFSHTRKTLWRSVLKAKTVFTMVQRLPLDTMLRLETLPEPNSTQQQSGPFCKQND